MKSNALTITRFVLALLTILALFIQPRIPLKTLVMHPQVDTYTSIFGEPGSYQWLDEYNSVWRCNHNPRQPGSCGFALVWEDFDVTSERASTGSKQPFCKSTESDTEGNGWGWEDDHICYVNPAKNNKAKEPVPPDEHPVCTESAVDPDNDGWGWQDNKSCRMPSPQISEESEEIDPLSYPLDFSRFDGLEVTIHYEGRARYLNVRMANSETIDGRALEKNIATLVHTKDLKAGPAFLALSDFAPEEWWVRSENIPRQHAGAAFDKIISLAITHVDSGLHKMRVERIELVGERVKMTELLVVLAIFWACYLLLEALYRYYQLRTQAESSANAIERLTQESENLEAEKSRLAAQSITDPLTAALNRTGIMLEIEQLYLPGNNKLNFGLLMIDVDYFKSINDTYGHDTGDEILTSIVKIISANIREKDSLARWGGEEFLLVCKEPTTIGLIRTAEKLREIVAAHSFAGELELHVTVSVGIAQVKADESFEDTFKRADLALYRAKAKRNLVFYEQ